MAVLQTAVLTTSPPDHEINYLLPGTRYINRITQKTKEAGHVKILRVKGPVVHW